MSSVALALKIGMCCILYLVISVIFGLVSFIPFISGAVETILQWNAAFALIIIIGFLVKELYEIVNRIMILKRIEKF